MNLSQIKLAIFNWIKAATLGTAGLTIYWDEPNAPRPPMPSLRLSFATGVSGIGIDSLLPTNQTGKFRIVGDRQLLLSINAYGPQAHQLLSDILTSLANPLLMDGLAAVKISVLRTSPPRDLNITLETKVEARTQMDVTLLCTEDKIIDLSAIESVEVSGDIAGVDLITDIDGITDIISANNGGV